MRNAGIEKDRLLDRRNNRVSTNKRNREKPNRWESMLVSVHRSVRTIMTRPSLKSLESLYRLVWKMTTSYTSAQAQSVRQLYKMWKREKDYRGSIEDFFSDTGVDFFLNREKNIAKELGIDVRRFLGINVGPARYKIYVTSEEVYREGAREILELALDWSLRVRSDGNNVSSGPPPKNR